MILGIHELRAPEDKAEIIQITVYVANRNESLWRLVRWCRCVGRENGESQQQPQEDRSCKGPAQAILIRAAHYLARFSGREPIDFDWKS